MIWIDIDIHTVRTNNLHVIAHIPNRCANKGPVLALIASARVTARKCWPPEEVDQHGHLVYKGHGDAMCPRTSGEGDAFTRCEGVSDDHEVVGP